jgi:ATP-dependent RNA helicase DDX24/MAK5
MDIVGAAETGSGKTLAFGIPIVQGILQDRRQEQAGGTGQATEEEGGGQSADQEGGESADEMEAESPDSLPEEETNDKLVTAEGNKKKGKSNIRTAFGNRSSILP